MLLDGRQLGKGNFHSQVAAGNHDAFAGIADVINVVHAGLVFDLGNDVDVSAAVFRQEAFQVQQILFARHKGCRDKIHLVPDSEEQVRLVLFAEVDLPHHFPGEAHALAVGEDAAGQHVAADFGFGNLSDPEDDQPVVHQDPVTHLQVFRQTLIADGNNLLIPDHLARCKGKAVPVPECDFPVLESPDAILRTLGVQHDGNRQFEFLPDRLDHVDLFLVLLMGAVGKVQARNIEPLQAHFPEDLGVFTGRADRADDFCFPHVTDSPFSAPS